MGSTKLEILETAIFHLNKAGDNAKPSHSSSLNSPVKHQSSPPSSKASLLIILFSLFIDSLVEDFNPDFVFEVDHIGAVTDCFGTLEKVRSIELILTTLNLYILDNWNTLLKCYRAKYCEVYTSRGCTQRPCIHMVSLILSMSFLIHHDHPVFLYTVFHPAVTVEQKTQCRNRHFTTAGNRHLATKLLLLLCLPRRRKCILSPL